MSAEGDHKTANASILTTDNSKKESDLWNGRAMLSVWMLYRDKLTPEGRAFIKDTMTAALNGKGSIRRRGLGGAGKNKELTASVIRMIGGEQFGIPSLAKTGYKMIDSMARSWGKTGSWTEHNSPTYQAVYMIALSMVWMYSTNEDVARKARILEERAWMEMAMRFHTPSWSQIGPFERAYGWDVVGLGTDTQYLYRHAVGPDLPLRSCLAFKKLFAGDHYPMDYRLSWAGRTATQTHNCPAYLVEFMRRAQKDFNFSSTLSLSQPEALVSYMDRNISLGTAMRNITGNRQALHITGYWSKGGPVRDKEDRRSFASRDFDIRVFQKKNRMLNVIVGKRRCSYRLCNYSKLDEVRIGGRRIDISKAPARTRDDAPLCIRDGAVYVAMKPLERAGARKGDAVKISMEKNRGYDPEVRLSFSSTDDASYHVLAIEFVNAEDYKSFDDYCKQVQAWNLTSEQKDGTIVARGWTGTDREMEMHLAKKQINQKRSDWRITRRLYNGKRPREGAMVASVLRADHTGEQTVNGAALRTRQDILGLLWADPVGKAYVGMIPTPDSGPLKLTTPLGNVSVGTLGFGRVELTGAGGPRCDVEAVTLEGTLEWSGVPSGARVIVNGTDVTAKGKVNGKTWKMSL